MKKIFVTAIVAILLASAGVSYKYATSPKEELSDIAENYEVIKIDDERNPSEKLTEDGIFVDKRANEDLKVEGVEEGSSTEKIIKIQKEIEKLENEKASIQDDLFVLNNEIYTYRMEMRKLDAEKEKASESIADYLKWLFFTHDSKDMYLSIFNAKSLNELIYNYDLTNEYVSLTTKNIKKIAESHQEMDENRNEVVNKKTLNRVLMTDISKKEQELIEKHKELAAIMEKEQGKLLAESVQSTNSIAARINASNYRYTGQRSGKMILPVENYTVTSNWGNRVHPITGDVRHHAGIDLGVDYGSVVRAAADGVVTMASWYGGYGKAVVIDHGGHISTLYGHNSNLLVKEGQYVKQGQPIALAGSTGNSTGPHCHFEVRQNGTDIDPLTFIR